MKNHGEIDQGREGFRKVTDPKENRTYGEAVDLIFSSEQFTLREKICLTFTLGGFAEKERARLEQAAFAVAFAQRMELKEAEDGDI